jgi:hypothetical protein
LLTALARARRGRRRRTLVGFFGCGCASGCRDSLLRTAAPGHRFAASNSLWSPSTSVSDSRIERRRERGPVHVHRGKSLMPLRRRRTLAVDVVAPVPTEPLYREIRAVLESARSGAYRAVNAAMVQGYWHVGRLIVEHEQNGRHRAGYGEALIATLAQRLTRDMGRGFDERNLWYMRGFYLAFPILNAPRSELPDSEILNAARSELAIRHPTRDESPALRPELSWTHYRILLRVEDATARAWYLNEAVEQHWSTRQLERQISVLYYERLLASRTKAPVRREAATKLATVEPEQFIRDPYVLEFTASPLSPARSASGLRMRTSTWTSSSTTICSGASC